MNDNFGAMCTWMLVVSHGCNLCTAAASGVVHEEDVRPVGLRAAGRLSHADGPTRNRHRATAHARVARDGGQMRETARTQCKHMGSCCQRTAHPPVRPWCSPNTAHHHHTQLPAIMPSAHAPASSTHGHDMPGAARHALALRCRPGGCPALVALALARCRATAHAWSLASPSSHQQRRTTPEQMSDWYPLPGAAH